MGCSVLAAVAALAACGDDDSDAPKVETSKLASIEALTPSQYTAIEKVYVAALRLDERQESAATLRLVLRPVQDACDDLDADDPLLGVLRTSCPVGAEMFKAVTRTDDCGSAGKDECADAFEDAQATTQRLVEASRASNRAVNATRLPQGCKRALLTPPESLERGAALERALGMVANDDTGARRTLVAAQRQADGTSEPQLLDLLRRNCH